MLTSCRVSAFSRNPFISAIEFMPPASLAAVQQDLLEVVFELPERQRLYGGVTESLWAVCLDDYAFRVLSTPFHVYGISLHDVIAARPLPGSGSRFAFDGLLVKSGHSTYRIFTFPQTKVDDFLEAWEPLEALGCVGDQAPGDLTALYSIHVPRRANIERVLVLLREAQVAGVWDFEQGDCGHVL